MASLDSQSRRFIRSMNDRDELRVAYGGYIKWLRSEPLWSAKRATGSRILWRFAGKAAKHSNLSDAFELPGLYLFGSEDGIPLYLGMTERLTLWKRLANRYVRGKRSQCQLAVDFQGDLISRGIDGFPNEVISWYRKHYRSSNARLLGAVAFAQHGIEGIWFSILPVRVSERALIRELEKSLIPIANDWNRTHAYPALLNVQDVWHSGTI